MGDVGIGVVGCGLIGTRHGVLFDSLDGVSLKAMCDVDGERAEAAASRLGVKAYTSVDEMVLDDSIDAVIVATSGSHGGPAETAARAGKHVMVETSFAATLRECDRIIDAGERSGAIIIDHIRWMAGSEIEEVYAVGMGRHVGGGDGEDNGLAGIRFKNGVFASLLGASGHPGVTDSWWRLGGDRGLVEYSELAGLRLGRDGWTDVAYEGKGQMSPHWFRMRMPSQPDSAGYLGWKAELEEFVASIRGGRQPAVTGYDGRACTEAAIAIVRSHETGKPVRLPL